MKDGNRGANRHPYGLKSVKKGLTKLVRIDHKTEIEVSVDIPDEVAIKKYHKNYG